LPPTYVFEGLRGVLLDRVLRADLMLTGLAINSLLFAAAAVGFARKLIQTFFLSNVVRSRRGTVSNEADHLSDGP